MTQNDSLTRKIEFLNEQLDLEKRCHKTTKEYYRDRVAVLESQLNGTADAVWFYDTSLPKTQLDNCSCPAVAISPDLLARLLQGYSEGQLATMYKQSTKL